MHADFPLILDACVLAPHGVCDLFLRLAEEPRLYSPRWTHQILQEVHRTQVQKLGFPTELADHWQEEVARAFPEARVEGYEPLIAQCQNDPKDRHVLAAAIKAPASAIVTFNLKHFPRAALDPYSIVAHHPGQYLCTLYDMNPGIVTTRMHQIAQNRGLDIADQLRRLARALPQFAAYCANEQGIAL